MKLIEKKGKAARQDLTLKRVNKRDSNRVVQLGEGHSVCFGLGRDTCRQTDDCHVRTLCLSGWQCFFGLGRR